MNVLPLVLLILLTLSAVTVRQIEHFKNLKILHKEYTDYINDQEGRFLNERQQEVFAHERVSSRQLYFGAFMGKGKLDEAKIEQLKLITKELMRLLYGHTGFYKKIERKRPQVLDDLLEQIIKTFEEMPQEELKTYGRIENLPQLRLNDPELQEVLYHMLKGSVSREDFENIRQIGLEHAEKTYPSLLDFITERAKPNKQPEGSIAIYRAPKELLAVIYGEGAARVIAEQRKQFKSSDSKENDTRSDDFDNYLKEFPKAPNISDLLLHTRVTTSPPP